jgi:hypothetical protein
MEFRGGDLLGVIFEGEVELVALIVVDMFEETGENIMKENITTENLTTENITMVAIKIRRLRLL